MVFRSCLCAEQCAIRERVNGKCTGGRVGLWWVRRPMIRRLGKSGAGWRVGRTYQHRGGLGKNYDGLLVQICRHGNAEPQQI